MQKYRAWKMHGHWYIGLSKGAAFIGGVTLDEAMDKLREWLRRRAQAT